MTTPTPNVKVTLAAEKFIRRMLRMSGHPTGGMRLEVTAGGCSGYSSSFSVEAAALAGDAELAVNGVRLFLPAGSRVLLDGCTIDFADTPASSGFTFVNPNQAACGCASASDAAVRPAHASVPLDTLRRAVRDR